MDLEVVKALACDSGFELAGAAPADPVPDIDRFDRWLTRGMAAEMRYLTDHRADVRRDVRRLLPTAKSVICVGKLYNTGPGETGIARYARSIDYHVTMRTSLEELTRRLLAIETFEYKICVDTAPLLERSFARQAGLGWIGKNTCLINQDKGSWFLLGEIVTSLDLTASSPPPDRCGTCTRCIDACPTQALVPEGSGWTLDSRRCVSYLTIELRGPIPEEFHTGVGANVFGCDICQEVCPWNSDAPVTGDPAFQPVVAGPIEELDADAFRATFGKTPVMRSKHAGFLRNLEIVRRNGR